MPSPRFQLHRDDLSSIGRGLLVAMAGAGLTFLATTVSQTDFAEWTPWVAAAAAVAVNAARKWLADSGLAPPLLHPADATSHETAAAQRTE